MQFRGNGLLTVDPKSSAFPAVADSRGRAQETWDPPRITQVLRLTREAGNLGSLMPPKGVMPYLHAIRDTFLFSYMTPRRAAETRAIRPLHALRKRGRPPIAVGSRGAGTLGSWLAQCRSC